MEPFANKPSAEQPTGDLEHLFRQKFAEAEVMPRRSVWEQIDHELLVRQNEAYRRRIVQQRWLAAACILLVLAASTWAVQSNFLRNSSAATVARQVATSSQAKGQAQGIASQQIAATAIYPAPASAGMATLGSVATSAETAQLATTTRSTPSQAILGDEVDAPAAFIPELTLVPSLRAGRTMAFNPALVFNSGRSQSFLSDREPVAGGAFARQIVSGGYPSSFSSDKSSAAAGTGWFSDITTARIANQLASMIAGDAFLADSLRKAALPAGPEALAAQEVKSEPEPQPRSTGRRWKLSAAVAAASYNPNINFSRTDAVAVPVSNGLAADAQSFRTSSEAVRYERAAAEYRQHLQAKPSVRARIGAARSIGRHWELATGVEFASQAASSQFEALTTTYSPSTANAFVVGSSSNYPLSAAPSNGPSNGAYVPTPVGTSTTHYRYTSAGVPVAVRYGSAKTGWSLYATVGAAVNVLLGSKVETEGAVEGKRTYSLTSTDSPYRKVLGSVRGGAGARYRAADGQWSVLVGPEADLGLTTLNADPAQSFFKRSRPYSVGLATSVEFGSAKPMVVSH